MRATVHALAEAEPTEGMIDAIGKEQERKLLLGYEIIPAVRAYISAVSDE